MTVSSPPIALVDAPAGSPAPRRRRLAVLASGLLAALAAPAAAQDAAGLHLELTPYLWIAGVSGTLRTPLPTASQPSVSAGFGDVLSNLNAIPIMGAAELRYGQFGLVTDLIAISVKVGIKNGDAPLYSGGDVRVTQVIGTALGMVRVVDDGAQSLDLGLGVRAFGLSTDFTLNAGVLPAVSRSPGASWADPLIGARYRYGVAERWGVTLAGDFGATSSHDQTWQALGTVDYRIGMQTAVHLGYRHMNFIYGSAAVHQNMRMSGPILGATFQF